jgi:hypothetical protein
MSTFFKPFDQKSKVSATGGPVKVIAVTLTVSLLLAVTACAPQKTQDVYFVMIEGRPNIYDSAVYRKGIDIGRIVSQEVGSGNITRLTIHMTPAHAALMSDNSVFYVSNNTLNYTTIANYGDPLPMESKILGFASKTSLYWFKTKTLLGQSKMAANGRAGQLFEMFDR